MKSYSTDLKWAMQMAVIQEGIEKKILLNESACQTIKDLPEDKLYNMVFSNLNPKDLEDSLNTYCTEAEQGLSKSAAMKQWMKTFGERAKKIVERYPRSSWAVVGGISTVAIGAIAYYIYRRFISRMSKDCMNLKGPARQECIANFKRNAIKATLISLKSARGGCSRTKDPTKCQFNYDKKIQYWWEKLSKLDSLPAEKGGKK